MKINENGYIEPEIGDVFKDKHISLNVIESNNTCLGCFYSGEEDICPPLSCLSDERDDKKEVIFKQVIND